MPEQIEIKYGTMAEIGRRLARCAEAVEALQQRIQQQVGNLENGGWAGEGSQAFFNEMNQAILPALQRLVQGLEAGDRTSQQIATLFREAEEAARKPSSESLVQPGDGNVVQFAAYTPGEPMGGELPRGAIDEITVPPPPPPKNRSLQYVVRNPKSVFTEKYFDQLRRTKLEGSGSKALNSAMERLLENPSQAEREQLLVRIANLRRKPLPQVRAEYEKFLDIQRTQRRGPDKLDYKSQWLDFSDHPDFLGSTTSLRYGKVVGDVFGIDPVFGALLNPTGGIMGPGSSALPQPGPDRPLAYHSIFHDAGGYLKNTHGLGPGYDYLGRESAYDPTHQLTGQKSGMRYWHSKMNSPGPDWLTENAAEAAMDAYIWKEGGRRPRPKGR
jgi:WXG100 family type VII secretion target